MDKAEILQFIKDNIEIVVEWGSQYPDSSNQTIGLSVKGDTECFTKATVIITDAIGD